MQVQDRALRAQHRFCPSVLAERAVASARTTGEAMMVQWTMNVMNALKIDFKVKSQGPINQNLNPKPA